MPRIITILFSSLIFALLVADTLQAEINILRHLEEAVDGRNPHANLVTDGTKLYGSTSRGGPPATNGFSTEVGTVFSMNPDGSDFRLLLEVGLDTKDGTDFGARPGVGLLYHDSKLFVVMNEDGMHMFEGVVSSVNTDGSNPMLLINNVGGATDKM